MDEPPKRFCRMVSGSALIVVAAAIVTPWSIPFEHGIAAAAWVAPVLLLLIARRFTVRLGQPIVGAILIASAWIASDGLLSGPQRPLFAVLFGLVQLAPYAIDKGLCCRLPA